MDASRTKGMNEWLEQRWRRERDRSGGRQRMQHHEPSRHALHVNVSRSASTEITTLCLCVCVCVVTSYTHYYARRGGFSILHRNQSNETLYIDVSYMLTWPSLTSCVCTFHMSEPSSVYLVLCLLTAVRAHTDHCWITTRTLIPTVQQKRSDVSPV